MNSFFAWVGNTDISFYCKNDSSPNSQETNISGCPLETALRSRNYDNIYLLLTSQYESTRPHLQSCLPQRVQLIQTHLSNPIDYYEIYKICYFFLAQFYKEKDHTDFLLSSGTPAMAAIWLLLGKTLFPAHFLQTYQNCCTEVNIPFRMSVDLIPAILNDQDRAAQQIPYEKPYGFQYITGQSPAIRKAIEIASRAAIHNISILLCGESGTGKELFAHAIHQASPRRHKAFEAINCAALPPNLLESELFGYRKGAFTGASKDHAGAFERVDGGTLFLDEIGECSLELQVKLLRALQPLSDESFSVREYYPVGAEKAERSDIRLICATNRNLLAEIQKGCFRADLYYRIATISIQLPPLRERNEDILLLAESLKERAVRQIQKENPEFKNKYFSESTKKFIQSRDWPGNVRQLQHAVLQGIILCKNNQIDPDDLGVAADSQNLSPFEEKTLGETFSLDREVQRLQKFYLEKALSLAGGNKSKAARLLGLASYQRFDSLWKK